MERVQTTIRLPTEILEKLKEVAIEKNIPLNQLTTLILRQGLELYRTLPRSQQHEFLL